jgi:hypothetical protein
VCAVYRDKSAHVYYCRGTVKALSKHFRVRRPLLFSGTGERTSASCLDCQGYKICRACGRGAEGPDWALPLGRPNAPAIQSHVTHLQIHRHDCLKLLAGRGREYPRPGLGRIGFPFPAFNASQ